MRQQLHAERQELLQQLAERARDVGRSEEEARLFEGMFAQFQAIRGASLTCLDSAAALAAFDRKLGEIQKNIEDARRNRDPKLLSDLERLKAAVSTAAGLKSSTQRALTEAQGARRPVVDPALPRPERSADIRAWTWMRSDEASPHAEGGLTSRKAATHFQLNLSDLKSAMKKGMDGAEGKFLDEDIVQGISPWATSVETF